MRLAGKTAVVTGAGRGIGRAIALRLAREGTDVFVNDIDAASAGAVAAEVSTLGRRAEAVPGDVTEQAMVEGMVRRVAESRGRLDIMVANAGVVSARLAVDIPEAEWDRVMAVNAKGVFLCATAAARLMIGQKSGKIITCASVAGHEGAPYLSHYSASKFAVVGFTQALAKELARYGITVNAYCPGIVDTDMWRQLDRELGAQLGLAEGEAFKRNLRYVPLRRAETPEDVAGVVAFLAGPDADYITGQAINVDGGMDMR
ncbi:MAG: glucose 1-dehydrogenase [Candidatus Rokubacteria bacterium]|nr:glucose 1-dehydrogenase [Candidatus Rokubacteria bacterium]